MYFVAGGVAVLVYFFLSELEKKLILIGKMVVSEATAIVGEHNIVSVFG